MARTANVAMCNGTNARVKQGEKIIHAHYTSNTYERIGTNVPDSLMQHPSQKYYSSETEQCFRYDSQKSFSRFRGNIRPRVVGVRKIKF